MGRISLVEAYDNRSVIKQIYDLKQKSDEAIEESAEASITANQASDMVSGAITDASQALATANGLSARIDNVQTTANDANRTAEQAETNAGNAVFTANQANTTANALSGRIDTQNTTIGTLVKSVAVETTATDGTIKATLQDGTVVQSGVPIASGSKAGLMNSQTFNSVAGNARRIDALESGANIWYVAFASTTPTQDQITEAYNTANPDVAVQVGFRVIDLSKNLTYVYDGTQWIRPTSSEVPAFIQGQAGTIKGGDPASEGVVIAEPDGTGSVQGWSALTARMTSAEGNISSNASSISEVSSRLATAVDTLTTADANATQALSDAATAQSTATYAKNTVDAHTPLISGNACHAISCKVPTTGWGGSSAPFSYALAVDGLGANDIVWFAPADTVSMGVMSKAGVFAIGQVAGTLNLTAKKKPTAAFNVNIVRRGD